MSRIEQVREAAQRAAEVALWAGRPGDALTEVNRALTTFKGPDLTMFCGRLLTMGLRACADLAERARARREGASAHAAESAAASLAAWIEQMGGPRSRIIRSWPRSRPTAPPGMPSKPGWPGPATPPPGRRPLRPGRTSAARIGPDTRGGGRPRRIWTPDSPHRRPPRLQAAAAAAEGHAPLLAQIHALAQRARIPLQAVPAPPPENRRRPAGALRADWP